MYIERRVGRQNKADFLLRLSFPKILVLHHVKISPWTEAQAWADLGSVAGC